MPAVCYGVLLKLFGSFGTSPPFFLVSFLDILMEHHQTLISSFRGRYFSILILVATRHYRLDVSVVSRHTRQQITKITSNPLLSFETLDLFALLKK